ncbi:hypothetical protein V511_09970 [Mesotoga sp. Brook.08.YT.4.2.5.1]|nr:hypothetical protein V511_09970 [Mesotoga sp. Brook.08.YT.4.2.5.1]RDI92417.1 hypothetical protein Q502_09140 [Mesotoga sp. Brook.08.YT.4.2.5.2.]
MTKVHDRLYVGSEADCFHSRPGWAVVHACKHPCHVIAVGYKGSLPKNHPNYLSLERGANLYLNIVDPDIPLFMPQTFVDFMNFAKKHYSEGMNLLIHCNLGESRAPSLALLFMAKGLHVISDRSYEEARKEFQLIYPEYMPGLGISTYFTDNWNELGKET